MPLPRRCPTVGRGFQPDNQSVPFLHDNGDGTGTLSVGLDAATYD